MLRTVEVNAGEPRLPTADEIDRMPRPALLELRMRVEDELRSIKLRLEDELGIDEYKRARRALSWRQTIVTRIMARLSDQKQSNILLAGERFRRAARKMLDAETYDAILKASEDGGAL